MILQASIIVPEKKKSYPCSMLKKKKPRTLIENKLENTCYTEKKVPCVNAFLARKFLVHESNSCPRLQFLAFSLDSIISLSG